MTGIIGTGSFAEVRLGYNKSNGEQVAIKLMKKNKRDKELMTSVHCEINFVERRLVHEKIVHTFDVFNTKENLFIVMEYMSGGMLFDLLHNEGHFSERVSRRQQRAPRVDPILMPGSDGDSPVARRKRLA